MIELHNMCEAFNCLPQAGGLLDQDAFLIWGMKQVKLALQDKEEADKAAKEAAARFKGK